MKGRIAQAKGIGHRQARIRQHGGLQAMQMPFIGDFFGQVGAYSDDLYPTLIELSAQFFQPT